MDLLILPLMFGALYFVMIRPQQKRQRELAQMLSSLKVDDDVITVGGMYGTIVDLDDDSIDLRVGEPGPVLRFRREAIVRVIHEEDSVDLDDSDDEDSVDVTTDDVPTDQVTDAAPRDAADGTDSSDAAAHGNAQS